MTSIRHLRTPTPLELADALTSPPTSDPPLTPRFRTLLVERLAAAAPPGHRSRRVDAFVVEHGDARFVAPFTWSARSSRRPLGTAALRRAALGPTRDVRACALDEIDALCDRARRGLARRGALGTWLADAPEDVRSLCAVEAATWAYGVDHLVDPTSHRDVVVGVADAWFTVPGARTSLCGRRDAIAEIGEGRHGVLRLRDGLPGPRAIDGLVVDALVDALAAGDHEQPTRVVGCWPDAGVCLAVEFDDDAARRAARVVLTSASTHAGVPLARPAATLAA